LPIEQIFGVGKPDDVGIGKVSAVFEAFIFEPKDVEVEFIALG
jgi:hypothetical protein